MILQALYAYYQRKAANDADAVAPEGFEYKEIPFIIVIGRNGNFIDLQDTREKDGKGKLRAKTFLVPHNAGKTSGIKANLLWDNSEYVFGISLRGEEQEKITKRHQAFIDLLNKVFGVNPADEGLAAIHAFLRDEHQKDKLIGHPVWKDVESLKTGNFTFRLDGDIEIIAERSAVQNLIAANAAQNGSEKKGLCLVTGENEPIARLHPAIKGVRDAQTSGAYIVSFNERAYESYSYTNLQGLNAPVGKSVAFAYTTALNILLGRDSRQRIQVGDASTVFWAEKDNPLEDALADFFNEAPKDDPDRGTEAVKALYSAPWAGNAPTESGDTKFYILGLAPNASRIAVRFWHVGTVAEIASNIRQHFEDMKICHADFQKPYLSLFRLLSSIAVREKGENVPPNLAGDTMKAILSGTSYPVTLLQAAVRRNRAAQNVSYSRAALTKACLNRANRYYNKDERELTMALDPDNMNIGYNLGRLFAVLEKVQEEANPGLNATIRDRYYGAASATPVAVFSTLMKLKNHHLSKLENRGRAHSLPDRFINAFRMDI